MIDEDSAVEELLMLFGWEDDEHRRFEALRVLRWARGHTTPSWDDYKAGLRR